MDPRRYRKVLNFGCRSLFQGVVGMLRKAYNPKGMPPPGGRYSQIVKATGKSLLFISGQVAYDVEGRVVGKEDFAAQTEQAFRNLKAALAAEGATFDDVVKMTTYVTDMKRRDELDKVRVKYLSKDPPASALIGVTTLPDPELMIAIEAVAVLE